MLTALSGGNVLWSQHTGRQPKFVFPCVPTCHTFFFRFSSLVTVHVGMVIVHVGINMYMYMYMYALCTATVARSYKGSENLVVTVQHLLLSCLHTVVALKIVTTCIEVYASKVMRPYGKNCYIPVGGA